MKKKKKNKISFLAGRHIAHLLIRELSCDLLFHNFQHTVNVVRGVRTICKNLGLTKEEKEILLLAAWFHDSGLTKTYKGHEVESQNLAKAFLEKYNYPEEKLSQVLACIGATQMPQAPTTLLERVICDADLFHLSSMEYYHLQVLLLGEWRRVLNKDCTIAEWAAENLTFLEEHHYWTTYGQDVLQAGKELNIEKCKIVMGMA